MEKNDNHNQSQLKGAFLSVEERFQQIEKEVIVVRIEQEETKKVKEEKNKKKEEERKRKHEEELKMNDPTKKEILQLDP